MPFPSHITDAPHPLDTLGEDDPLALWRQMNAGVWPLPRQPQQVDLFEEAQIEDMLNEMGYSPCEPAPEDLSDILGDDDMADDMFAPIRVAPATDRAIAAGRTAPTHSTARAGTAQLGGAEVTAADEPAQPHEEAAPPKEVLVTVFTLPATTHIQKGGDADSHNRQQDALRALHKTGPQRRLALPSRQWRAQLQQLRETFPNFEAAINLLEPHIGLLAQGYTSIHMRPLLLVGPPGIGKTKFVHSLAHVLQAPAPLFISMPEEDNGSTLIGSSTYWSNSHTGQLFQTLAWGNAGPQSAVANPLVILDEIDKTSDHHKTERSPLSSLYRLLEAETAAHTEDRSLPGIDIDARYVRFIATANTLEDLPLPLRTRMEIVHVPAPTTAQRQHIAQSMARAYAHTHQLPLLPRIPDDVLPHLLQWDPRELKGKLELAMQMAVVWQQPQLTLDCWEHVTQHSAAHTERPRMGFF